MSENLADVASMYIPFPRPVPVPTQDVDSAPISRICFNSSWLPYVLGALKSLARPEVWDAGESTRELASIQAQYLLSEGVDCLDTELGVGSGSIVVTSVSEYTTHTVPVTVLNHDMVLSLWSIFETESEGAHIYLRFDTLPPSGANRQVVCEVLAGWFHAPAIPQTWGIDWTDCSGTIHIANTTGATFTLTDIYPREMRISGVVDFSLAILYHSYGPCEV